MTHNHHPGQQLAFPTTVFIDVDGALLDSIPVLFNVYHELLQKYGVDGSKSEFRELIGLTAMGVIAALSDQHGLKQSPNRLLEEFKGLLLQQYNKEIPLVPGVDKFLEIAHQLGLSVAFVTMSQPTLTQKILQALDLGDYYDTLISLSDWEEKQTPSTNIYQEALSKLNINDEETVAIVASSCSTADALAANIPSICLCPNGRAELYPPLGEKKSLRAKDWDVITRFFMLWHAHHNS